MLDQVLYHLRLSVFDCIDSDVLARHMHSQTNRTRSCYVPIIEGRLGPQHPWPQQGTERERVLMSATTVEKMWQPVIARLGADSRMSSLFDEGDLVLLDQAQRTRAEPEADG